MTRGSTGSSAGGSGSTRGWTRTGRWSPRARAEGRPAGTVGRAGGGAPGWGLRPCGRRPGRCRCSRRPRPPRRPRGRSRRPRPARRRLGGCGSSAASLSASSGEEPPASSATMGAAAFGAGVGVYDDCQLSLPESLLSFLYTKAPSAAMPPSSSSFLSLPPFFLLLLLLDLGGLGGGELAGLLRLLRGECGAERGLIGGVRRTVGQHRGGLRAGVGDDRGGLVAGVGDDRGGLLTGVGDHGRGLVTRGERGLELRDQLLDVVRCLVDEGLVPAKAHDVHFLSSFRSHSTTAVGTHRARPCRARVPRRLPGVGGSQATGRRLAPSYPLTREVVHG